MIEDWIFEIFFFFLYVNLPGRFSWTGGSANGCVTVFLRSYFSKSKCNSLLEKDIYKISWIFLSQNPTHNTYIYHLPNFMLWLSLWCVDSVAVPLIVAIHNLLY